MNIQSYISGYVDGEGCFSVSIRPRPSNKIGWEVVASFAVAQNRDRIRVLKLMREYFNYGSFRRNISDKTMKYEIRNIDVLINKVIPHFKKYPIQSERRRDFEIFVKICEKIKKKEHLSKEGLIKIVKLRSQMSFSNNRIYTKAKILHSIK